MQTPDLLGRIKQRVAADLARLPNYICRETIERSERMPNARRFKPIDTVRLEVAFVGNRELYSWAGSARFEERPLGELITPAGAIGTGGFGLHVRNLFVRPGPEFTFAGQEQRDGRAAVRYDFRVPRESSLYEIFDGKHRARTAYRGSFWADPDTLDLIRLEVHVDEAPEPVEIDSVSDAIEYGRVRIGDAEFVLPRATEMTIASRVRESRNVTRFDNCRQYVGQSLITFGEAAGAAAGNPVRNIELPAGLQIEMELRTALRHGQTVIGDPVLALVTGDVKLKDGAVLLPKGARVSGRVTRLERYSGSRIEYSVVGLVLESVEAGDLRAAFFGELEDAGFTSSGRYQVSPVHERHEGVFLVRGGAALPPVIRMVWRTTEK